MNSSNPTFNFGTSPFGQNNQSTAFGNPSAPGTGTTAFGAPTASIFGNPQSSSGSALPTPLFGSNQASSMGGQQTGFGTNTAFQATSGTGFGGFQTSSLQNSAFGQNPAQGQSFQQTPSTQTSLFNNPQPINNVVNPSPFSGSSLFPSQTAQNTSQGQTFGQQNTSSLFPSSSQATSFGSFPSSTQSSFGTGFGVTSQPFSSNSSVQTNTGFGGQNTAFGGGLQQSQAPFGNTSAPFGSVTSQPFGNSNIPTTQSGFFNNTASSSGFQPSGFGSSSFPKPSTSFGGFGTNPTQQPGAFSQQPQTSTTSGFGQFTNTQTSQQTAFGASAKPFGTQTSSFGTQRTTGFGSSSLASTSFGGQQSSSLLGNKTNTVFGGAQPSIFGGQTQTSNAPFGNTSTSQLGFGGQGANTFGAPTSLSTSLAPQNSWNSLNTGQNNSSFGSSNPVFGTSTSLTGQLQGSGQSLTQNSFGGSGNQNQFEEASKRFQYHLKLGNVANANEDFVVPNPPSDTITKLRFCPKTNLLMCASWDGTVRCWEANVASQQVTPKVCQTLPDAVAFDINWNLDGNQLFMACSDNTAKLWDLNSNSITQIAKHDSAVRTVTYIQTPKFNCVMTGSWDKTICFWDLRSSTPINRFEINEKIFGADFGYPYAVLSTSNRGIVIYKVDTKITEFKKYTSSLKYQHRSLSMFKDGKSSSASGFAIGSVAGRVAVEYFTSSNSSFTFKCHRSELSNDSNVQDLYPVHDIKFHPVHGTMVTTGGDGYLGMWDKNKRARLKIFKQCSLPITCCDINSTGELLAYGIGYDWSRGFLAYNRDTMKPQVFIRMCLEDMKPHRY